MTGGMSLPAISRFAHIHKTQWRALGLRLREIGLGSECIAPIANVGEGLPPLLRAPLQRWHLARTAESASWAMRLLVFDDSISPREAFDTLGQGVCETLLEAGLLTKCPDGRIASLFPMAVADGLYLFSDDLTHGGDAVMGAGETTANLCRAAWPARPVKRLLEVGCGAGTVALVLARCADSVVATDINPRALALARVNAAINGVVNIEFCLGDRFAPVYGQTFDLIVSQPPFVARPPGARAATYLYGGKRGDELPLRIMAEIPAHLTRRGRAILLVEWPEYDDRPIEERIAAAIGGSDARCLHFRLPPTDPDLDCGMYAAAEAPGLGEAFERSVRTWRDHFATQGIHRLRTVCTVIQRDPEVSPWNASIDLPAEGAAELNAAAIDRRIANRDLVCSGRRALLAATLRIPIGATFSKEYTTEDSKPRYFVRLPPNSLTGAVELGEHSVLFLSMVHEEPTVGQAIEKFAAQRGLDFALAADQLLPALEQALLAGIIASSRPPQSYRHPQLESS
jgi:SAM-dependent methyltransferase